MSDLRTAAQAIVDCWDSGHFFESPDADRIKALREALAQPAQEPVAIVVAAEYEDGSHAGHRLEWRGRNEANDYPEGTEFYTAPPQRKPLPPKSPCEMTQAERKMFRLGWLECEAAHGIKGEQHG